MGINKTYNGFIPMHGKSFIIKFTAVILVAISFLASPARGQDGPDCDKTGKNRHEVYHVALLIPFYLGQVGDSTWKASLDPLKISDLAPFRFIQYYQGFMMAADSLRKEGLNAEIHIYDVGQMMQKAYQVIEKPELKNMDLIIGPFFKNTFPVVAEFAKENRIPIVNPFSVRDDILQDNPYVFKLLPSAESQPMLVADLVKRNFSDYKVIFYADNKYENSELIGQFTQAIEQNDATGRQVVRVADYASDSTLGFRKYASTDQPNLVIIYAENEVLPSALLSKLDEMKKDYQITVIGLPEWDKFANIESDYMIALNAIIFMSSYADNHSDDVKAFTFAYRAKYYDEPMYYAFSGFDAGYFFLGALMDYGKDFSGCINRVRKPLILNQYHFEKKDDGGYDNLNWNVLQYNDYFLLRKSSYYK